MYQADAQPGALPGGAGVVVEPVDAALKERVCAVLARAPVTEAELRKLAEEGVPAR